MNHILKAAANHWDKFCLAGIFLAALNIGLTFSVTDTLPGLFDDSAIYLIAAEIYSPWTQNVSSAFLESYEKYRHLPPGFPFLLALTGANHTFSSAHLLVITLLVLFIPVYYMYSYRVLHNKKAGILIVLMFMCTPGIWIESLKIASENLYILISFCVLLISAKYQQTASAKNIFIIAFLICLLVLTRTIGLSMLLAFLFGHRHTLFYYRTAQLKYLLALITAFLPLYVWIYHSASLNSSYGYTLQWLSGTPDPFYTIFAVILSNIYAFLDAWIQLTIIYQSDTAHAGSIISYILLLLSLAGFIHRRFSMDGVYLLIYLSVIMVWPYPHDMTRFIYPVFPLILIYSVVGLFLLLGQIKINRNMASVIGLLYLSITLPSASFIYQRYISGKSVHGYDISHLPTLYYEPHAGLAFLSSVEAMHYMKFLPQLKKHVPPEALILTLKPELVTYITGLHANQLPSIKASSEAPEFMAEIFKFNTDYILLSKIIFPSHPMGTDLMQVLSPYTEIVTQKYSPVIKDTSIILLKMKNQY
jgi:hypothetical protein